MSDALSAPPIERMRAFLRDLQDRICARLEVADGRARFSEDAWQRPEGGGGRSRVLKHGAVFEQAGVNFSRSVGCARCRRRQARSVPRSRDARGPRSAFRWSLHPDNPYVPTTHMNVRYFEARADDAPTVWWFGGGFDLTPYYPFDEDIVHWHTVARDLCAPFGADVYARYKRWCDEYFFLRHRGETRGVGGLFLR